MQIGSTITIYAVCEDPDEWGDAPLFEDYRDAHKEAKERSECVVELNYEYTDSSLVDDFRKEE